MKEHHHHHQACNFTSNLHVYETRNSLQHHHRQWSFTLCASSKELSSLVAVQLSSDEKGLLSIDASSNSYRCAPLTRKRRNHHETKKECLFVCPQLMSRNKRASILIWWITHIRKIPSWVEEKSFISVLIKGALCQAPISHQARPAQTCLHSRRLFGRMRNFPPFISWISKKIFLFIVPSLCARDIECDLLSIHCSLFTRRHHHHHTP